MVAATTTTPIRVQHDAGNSLWVLARGKEYIFSFPDREGCKELADQMAAELQTASPAEALAIKDKYRALKRPFDRRRGSKPPKAKTENVKGDEPGEPHGVWEYPRSTPEDKERRIGYTTGLTAVEVDRRVAMLPILIGQAQDAETSARKAQHECAALWAESDRQWMRVAKEILGLGSDGLRESLKLALEGGGE